MDERREHAAQEENRDAQGGAQTVEQTAETADQQTETVEQSENAEEGAAEQDAAQPEEGQAQEMAQPEEVGAQEMAQPEEAAADDSAARIAWLSAQLLTAKATAAATALGVKPERVKYAIRLSDLGDIDVTQEDADKRISAAIKQVVNELPELKGGTQGTGTQGAFARQSNVPMSAFERGLLG